MKIAVQLYSIRDGIKNGEDLLAALPKVAALGYEGVEFAGYFGLRAETLRSKLDEAGLKAVGTHMSLDDFRAGALDSTLDYCEVLGLKNIGVGGAAHSTGAELGDTCEVLRNASSEAAKRGIAVYYHNHRDEFEPNKDGIVPFGVIKSACKLEVDAYWSHCAGQDNYKLITENKGDIVLLHVKDGVGLDTRALGEGDCDIREIAEAARDSGFEWLIVENDTPNPDGISDIGRSIKYLKNILMEENI